MNTVIIPDYNFESWLNNLVGRILENRHQDQLKKVLLGKRYNFLWMQTCISQHDGFGSGAINV